MKKYLLFVIIYFGHKSMFGQQLFLSKTSSVRLFSEAPLENIAAVNTNGNAIIDFEKKEIAVKIAVNRFIFPNKMMQSHFNESYLESNLYPYIIFKGFFNKKIDLSKSSTFSVSANGVMTLHGINKMQILEGKMTVDAQNKIVTIDATFKVKLEEYKIKIPNLVTYKIAEDVEVNAQFTMAQITQNLSGFSTNR